MRENWNLKTVSDDVLLRRLADLVGRSRRLDADIVAHIAEVDVRRLYARRAMPSLFAYCVETLRLAENEAYLRIAAARASRAYPVLLDMLRDGRLHLSAVARLASHLTPENHEAVLARAANRSKREIEALIADLAPRPDVATAIRKLPARSVAAPSVLWAGSEPPPGSTSGDRVVPERVEPCALKPRSRETLPNAPPSSVRTSHRSRVEPLAPARFKVQFTADAGLRDKLERLQGLMRSSVPDGDLGKIIEQAVTEKLERLEARRLGKTHRPRKTLAETDTTPASRHVPAPVRRAVWARDGGRCAFVDEEGSRCPARDRLEFHHHGKPYARGGDHSPENVRLMCRTHNALMAEGDYGRTKMECYRRGNLPDPRPPTGSTPQGAYSSSSRLR